MINSDGLIIDADSTPVIRVTIRGGDAMTNAWTSAHEAIHAAEALCTIYNDSEGQVPGELLGDCLIHLKGAPPAAVAAFYDYLHGACPRLTALFAWSEP